MSMMQREHGALSEIVVGITRHRMFDSKRVQLLISVTYSGIGMTHQ